MSSREELDVVENMKRGLPRTPLLQEYHESVTDLKVPPYIDDLRSCRKVDIPHKVVQYIIQNKVTLAEAFCWYYDKNVELVMASMGGLAIEKLYDVDAFDPLLFEEVAKRIDSGLTAEHLLH